MPITEHDPGQFYPYIILKIYFPALSTNILYAFLVSSS